jgi:hypothetical protein
VLSRNTAGHVQTIAASTPAATPAALRDSTPEGWSRDIRNQTGNGRRLGYHRQHKDNHSDSDSDTHVFSILDLPMPTIQALPQLSGLNQRLHRAKLLQNSNTGSSAVPIANITGQLSDFSDTLTVVFTKGGWARTKWEQLGSPVDRCIQVSNVATWHDTITCMCLHSPLLCK